MSTRALVFPHRVVEGLVLEVTNPVDSESGQGLRGIRVEREDEIGQERWDLVEAKPTWNGVELDLAFTLTAEQLVEIVPDPATCHDDLVGIVSVMCASTNYRRGVRLLPGAEGEWRGTLLLPREDVYGLVELTPTVVRSRPAPADTDPRFASFPGAVLATGKAVQLICDRSGRRYDGSMEYVWEDFAQSKNSWRKARKDDVFHLEPGDTPTLFLNLRWPFLKPLLDFEGRSGTGAAMRDLTAATIAQGAWTQLFATAVASIVRDEDAYDVPGEVWRKDLVNVVLAEAYAELPADQRMGMAYEEWHDGATVGPLMSKIGAVAQSRATLGRLMDRAAKAMEAVASTEDL